MRNPCGNSDTARWPQRTKAWHPQCCIQVSLPDPENGSATCHNECTSGIGAECRAPNQDGPSKEAGLAARSSCLAPVSKPGITGNDSFEWRSCHDKLLRCSCKGGDQL